MNRFTFVHAADLHLDTPFEGVGRVPPAVAEVLRDASLDAWDALVRLTIERGAALLLLAGDLYDGEERGVRAQVRFRHGLETLVAHGVQVCMVHGNHDPLEGWSAIDVWPPGVFLFGSSDVTCVPIVRDGKHLAMVHGISFARRDCTENLARRFERGPEPGLHIALLHCNLANDPAHPPYAPCTIEDLRGANMDYWALGHIHRRTVLSAGTPAIVYPGNLQGRSLAASEWGEKGAVVVDVEDAVVQQVTFVPLDQVRIVSVDLDVSGTADRAALLRGLMELVDSQAGNVRLVLAEATLAGRWPAVAERGPVWCAELLDDIRRQAERHTPRVWWTAIRDWRDVTPERKRVRRRDDLAAALLRYAAALADDPDRRARFLDQRCEPLLRRWVADLEPGEVTEVFREAEDLAVTLLSGAERA